MKTLIIGNSKSVFAKELQEELICKGMDIYLLDFEYLDLYDKNGDKNDAFSKEFLKYKSIPKLHMFFRMMFIQKIIVKMNFEVVNIHIARWYYLLILKTLKNRKLIVSFYGSDFYRITDMAKKLLSPLLKCAKTITFTNEKTMKSFLQYNSGLKNKVKVCRFGLKTLDFIDKNRNRSKIDIKKELGYNTSKIIVTCGYNSTPAQQHEKIIENIIKLPQDILGNIQFVFPMTYGDNANKEKIKSVLLKTNLDYIVLEDFLRGDDNAYIKLVSDIMINILVTDSFSGSMQEFLYANNIVITGSWLPYDVFDNEGIIYEKIDSAGKLSDKLEDILSNLQSYKTNLDKNIDIISKLSSWKYNIQNWMEALK
ncbi:MAG: hypothetical protein IE890_04985 [Arcobacter sp.]|nr:hypothetical protein [Arcobacter sp.]